eukprot:EG_transcript_34209
MTSPAPATAGGSPAPVGRPASPDPNDPTRKRRRVAEVHLPAPSCGHAAGCGRTSGESSEEFTPVAIDLEFLEDSNTATSSFSVTSSPQMVIGVPEPLVDGPAPALARVLQPRPRVPPPPLEQEAPELEGEESLSDDEGPPGSLGDDDDEEEEEEETEEDQRFVVDSTEDVEAE